MGAHIWNYPSEWNGDTRGIRIDHTLLEIMSVGANHCVRPLKEVGNTSKVVLKITKLHHTVGASRMRDAPARFHGLALSIQSVSLICS